jgi:hypothetical protein
MSPMMIDRVMIPGCHLHTMKHASKLGKACWSQTVLANRTNRKHCCYIYTVGVMESWHFSGKAPKAFNETLGPRFMSDTQNGGSRLFGCYIAESP